MRDAFILVCCTLICYSFALQFEIFEGGADNYIHYRVSRYAFSYPELLLDHWGKPFFTLVSAPFAWFGFKGFILFNVVCGVLAAYFTWKTAEKLKLNYAWAAMVLVLSMPVYYIMMVSMMTEIFFSLILILSVYLILSERYFFASILFSSLFLIRTEGYIFYPFAILVFALKKQWLSIPFLATLPLIYSVIGWFYFGDFLWLIHQIPYGNTSELYGTGELLFFVKQYKLIFGRWASYLIFTGGLIAAFYFIKTFLAERKIKTDIILIEVLLFVYFTAHSYVWWSGTGASAGLIRVMAAVVPLAALVAMRTIHFLSGRNPFPKIYFTIALVLFSLYLLMVPFKTWPLPFKYGEREKTISAAVIWMQHSEYAGSKVYFYDPLIYFLLDRNPFDHSVIKELVDDREHPENVTKPGELIFYDMHFGPNEGRLPLKNLMDNSYFKLAAYFEPLEPFTVLGGYEYALLVFERVENNEVNNHDLLNSFKKLKQKKSLWKEVISSEKPITSGEFASLLEVPVDEIDNLRESQILRAELNYTFEEDITRLDQLLVISVEQKGQSLIYKTAPMEFGEAGEKMTVQCNAVISRKLKGDETVKIYIWNRSRNKGIINQLNVYTIKKTY